MLQFILGRASSGKTHETVLRALKCAESGGEPIILVPEQFSFECEKKVLELKGGASNSITVLSFTRLCDEVERFVGGVCKKTLTDSDKLILMKKALKSAGDGLKVWGKYKNHSGFAAQMVQTVSEFKINAVNSDDLLSAAENINDDILKAKIEDTALIFSAYNEQITKGFVDSTDRLTSLYDNLEKFRFFENKTVFIDSFFGFTGQQFKIIDRILAQSRDVTLSFTLDPKTPEYGVFENVNTIKKKIERLAGAHGIKKSEDIILDGSRCESEDLKALEEYMCGYSPARKDLSDVIICKAQTVYDEAEFVARTIRKTVRTKGARYKDFAVIARSTADYEQPLKSAMKRNGVPCYIDVRTPLAETPVAATVLAAADLMQRVTTEKILRFYKSGINLLTEEELFELENYIYLWNIDGSTWLKEWDMDPRGFVLKDDKHKPKTDVAQIENLRLKAITPLLPLMKKPEDAKQAVATIIAVLDGLNAKESFEKLYYEQKLEGNMYFADVIRQSWDSVVGVFDSLVTCFGNENISPREFYDSLKSAISFGSIGVTPQTADEVIFGAADRIRPSKPKYVFIIGANQGVFPKTTAPTGIFGNSDRAKLIELGIEIPDKIIFESVNEEYLVYSNVCCAYEKLYLCCSDTLPDQTEGTASAFLNEIDSYFNIKTVKEPGDIDGDNYPETAESALSQFCRRLSEDKPGAAQIYAAFSENGEFLKRADAVLKEEEKPDFKLQRETVQKLFGKEIRMSPTGFEKFNSCRFKFFGQQGLRINELQPASFDNLQIGTLVHYILENALKEHRENISKLTEAEISDLVERLTEEYLDNVSGYRSVETSRQKYIVSKIKRSTKHVLINIAKEFGQTEFIPVGFEVAIDKGGEIPEVSLPIPDCGVIKLTGTVDRIDRYKDYVRIVDYKLNGHSFNLNDILYGQNMQMILYLYAVCKSEKYGNAPAGVLYRVSSQKRKGPEKMAGLVLDDEAVKFVMDKSEKGEFIDKKSAEKALTDEEFQKVFDYTKGLIINTGKFIYGGNVNPNPVNGANKACAYCPFSYVCKIEEKDITEIPKLKKAEVMQEMERRGEENAD